MTEEEVRQIVSREIRKHTLAGIFIHSPIFLALIYLLVTTAEHWRF